jgi:hypothetical protein
MADIDLTDYITVAERISLFAEQFPNGSLSRLDRMGNLTPVELFRDLAGADWILITAYAYRDPEDTCPGVGTAWERIPGTTPYTRGSEIQNAETSAWGRAIVAALAGDTSRSIASRDEVVQAVARQKPLPVRDWLAEAKARPTAEGVRNLWREAKAKGASDEVLDEIAIIGVELQAVETSGSIQREGS